MGCPPGFADGAAIEAFPMNPEQAEGHVIVSGTLMVNDQPARLLTYEAMLSGVGLECVREYRA